MIGGRGLDTKKAPREAWVAYAAFLRAVNVGGTGKLAMVELQRVCAEAGFVGAKTYVQSGNVALASAGSGQHAKARLEAALVRHLGAPVAVFVRTRAELEAALDHARFEGATPSHVLVYFLDAPCPRSELDALRVVGREDVRATGREVLVHYPEGVGASKLRLPFASRATGRNLNTVHRMVALVAELEAQLVAG